jgi:hypothetical protein
MRRVLLTTDEARGRRSQQFFETSTERERERERDRDREREEQQQQPHWHNMYLPEVFVKATTCIQGIPSRNFAPLPPLDDLQTPKPISSLQKRCQKNHTRIGEGTKATKERERERERGEERLDDAPPGSRRP